MLPSDFERSLLFQTDALLSGRPQLRTGLEVNTPMGVDKIRIARGRLESAKRDGRGRQPSQSGDAMDSADVSVVQRPLGILESQYDLRQQELVSSKTRWSKPTCVLSDLRGVNTSGTRSSREDVQRARSILPRVRAQTERAHLQAVASIGCHTGSRRSTLAPRNEHSAVDAECTQTRSAQLVFFMLLWFPYPFGTHVETSHSRREGSWPLPVEHLLRNVLPSGRAEVRSG